MPHAKVEAQPIDAAGNSDALTAAVNKLIDRTPEEKLADRTEALTYLRKGRPLPAGKTFDEVVRGSWRAMRRVNKSTRHRSGCPDGFGTVHPRFQ